MSEKRQFDILLWGITGWTGVHLLEHFVQNYPLDNDSVNDHGVSWAVVARNEEKMAKTLKQVADNFGAEWLHDSVKTFTVDNMDEEAVDEVIAKAKSVATVVGPYAEYGEPIIKSCVKNGTHYTDITGEYVWVRKMIDKYHTQAMEKGVFLIPFCGCDSIPSDITAFAAVKYLNAKASANSANFSDDTQRKFTLRGYCTKMDQNNRHEGGPAGGGGTMASFRGILKDSTKETEKAYYLTAEDDECQIDKDHQVLTGIGREKRLPNHSWTTFFPLAGGDEKVVRRSRYLLPQVYGKAFSFHEKKAVSNLFQAGATSGILSIGFMLLSNSLTRGLVSKFLPKPSQTPNPKPLGDKYKPGGYEYVLLADAEYKFGDGVEKLSCKTTFSAPDEIAWTYTSVLLGESCLAIAKNTETVRKESGYQGGLLTTACLGNVLIERLLNKTDVKLETVDLVQ